MLIDTIRAHATDAMKARDSMRVTTLRSIIAAYTNELVAKGRKPTETLTDEETILVLKRLVKQRKEAAEQFTAGNRPELAEKEKQELGILEAYVPQMASREDVEKIARSKQAEMNVDAKSAGKLMGAVMKELGGRADGAVVKEVVTSLFQ